MKEELVNMIIDYSITEYKEDYLNSLDEKELLQVVKEELMEYFSKIQDEI
jgi:hypothetical protein